MDWKDLETLEERKARRARDDAFWDRPDEEVQRDLTFCEEDRHLFTSTPWNGGFRWFRSPNVVCLEKRRRDPKQARQAPSPKTAA
jgi:hypothetical protein